MRRILFYIKFENNELPSFKSTLENVVQNPYYKKWMTHKEVDMVSYDVLYEGDFEINRALNYLNAKHNVAKYEVIIQGADALAEIFIVASSEKGLDTLSLDIPSPPFPSTQSAAESFRDFAQSFIWDYSLLKSFSVDVPILEKQSDAIVRITKIAAEAIISYTWFKILSPYEYETRYTKAQLLAAPAYRVLELPEDRVLIQSYPNPFEEDALVLAAYFGPLHEYLEKIRLENKSNPEVQAIVQRRIAELNKARFEKFGE